MFIQYEEKSKRITSFQVFPSDNCFLFSWQVGTSNYICEKVSDDNHEALSVARDMNHPLYFIGGSITEVGPG